MVTTGNYRSKSVSETCYVCSSSILEYIASEAFLQGGSHAVVFELHVASLDQSILCREIEVVFARSFLVVVSQELIDYPAL